MSDVQLGMIAPDSADRDATHVAVAPMVAAVDMQPGQHCGPMGGGLAGPDGKHIGIVDPFLRNPVKKGQRFFLCLYPRSVTGLRHHYLHPDLDGDSTATSRAWIAAYAEEIGDNYEGLMAGADRWVKSGQWDDFYYGPPSGEPGYEYHGLFEGVSTNLEFWSHYERVRGVAVPESKRSNFFTCAC